MNNFQLFSFIIYRPEIPPLRDRGVVIPAPSQPMSLAPTIFQPPALEDLEAPKRQTSLDGEAIKIVIHDVDSGPICSSKRRVLLRKDPTDKAHRSKWRINMKILKLCCPVVICYFYIIF